MTGTPAAHDALWHRSICLSIYTFRQVNCKVLNSMEGRSIRSVNALGRVLCQNIAKNSVRQKNAEDAEDCVAKFTSLVTARD